MTTLETIDRLCTVVEAQAKLIREQATFIEEQLAVEEEIKQSFSERREVIDNELDLIEIGLRPIRNTITDKAIIATAGKEEA